MGIYSEEQYGIKKGVYCSMPVTTDNFSYKVVENLKISEDLKGKLKISV